MRQLRSFFQKNPGNVSVKQPSLELGSMFADETGHVIRAKVSEAPADTSGFILYPRSEVVTFWRTDLVLMSASESDLGLHVSGTWELQVMSFTRQQRQEMFGFVCCLFHS